MHRPAFVACLLLVDRSTPMHRPAFVAFLLPVVALLASCDRVAHAVSAIADPQAAFDAACAKLPTTEVLVRSPTPGVRERRDVPQSALKVRQGDASALHRTVGLTEVEFHQALDVRYSGLQDGKARACVRPQVRVDLSLDPLTVYVAREYDGDPCREPLIRAHEQRHVDVYAGYVAEAAPRLQRSLAELLGAAPVKAATPEDAQRIVQDRLQAAMADFRDESARELAARNAEVDTPEEYAALSQACSGTP